MVERFYENSEKQSPDVFCKKRCSQKFSKIHRKHLCQSLYFNKVAGLRPQECNFIKTETLPQVLSCEFCKISNNIFFLQNTFGGCFEIVRIGLGDYSIIFLQSNLLMLYSCTDIRNPSKGKDSVLLLMITTGNISYAFM